MKILNLCPYWVYPPNSGGSIRIYNLNQEISKKYEVSLMSFRARMGSDSSIFRTNELKLNNNFTEKQFSNKTILLSSFLLYKLNLPYDILQSPILNITNSKKNKLDGEIIQIEHPWLFKFAYKHYSENPIILAAHNVEYILIEDLINKKAPYLKRILSKIRDIELNALQNSDMIFCVSNDDINTFNKDFNINKKKMKLIPNGVDCKKYKIYSEKEKSNFKKKLGLPDKKIALFIGSDHFPNREAIQSIKQFAAINKDVLFLVVGEAGKRFQNTENIIFTGHVKSLIDYITAADIAINPLSSGSGTNLKMLEYLAAGLPTITTEIGNRGLNLKNGKEIILSELSQFPEYIDELASDEDNEDLISRGRERVEKEYDWEVIANKAIKYYETLKG